MIKTIVDKVLTYCVRGDDLLVFRHVDYSAHEVGIQTPGGSVRPGENYAEAALRELVEETGFEQFEIVRLLGDTTYDISPYRLEVQQRRFFLAHPTADLPDRWIAGENHDGARPTTRFEFFWIPLRTAHVLQAGQGALIGKV